MTEHKPVTPYGSDHITTPAAGDTYRDEAGIDWEILPACIGEDEPGHWFCLTHHEHLANNMQKHGHIDDTRRHRLAWMCHEHGYEVP